MVAEIEQPNGLKLSIAPASSSSNGILTIRLTGTNFLSEIVIGDESDGQGHLADFFINSASLAEPSGTWRDLCQDISFRVAVEPGYQGLFLHVNFGSNSNDDCDWQVTAILLVQPEQLLKFGSEIPHPQPEP